MKKLSKEVRDLRRETAGELDGLTEARYNRLADGSRAKARTKFDPELSESFRRLFDKS